MTESQQHRYRELANRRILLIHSNDASSASCIQEPAPAFSASETQKRLCSTQNNSMAFAQHPIQNLETQPLSSPKFSAAEPNPFLQLLFKAVLQSKIYILCSCVFEYLRGRISREADEQAALLLLQPSIHSEELWHEAKSAEM
nr:hypothetical protein Iba_chr08eCG3530 [Ipomoea batatas]